ncbi:MAG: hypothetical protein AAB389_01385 [Patescibacteria group bacterium]
MQTFRFRIQVEGFSWDDIELQAPSLLMARLVLTERLKQELSEDKKSWADYLAMRATFTEYASNNG